MPKKNKRLRGVTYPGHKSPYTGLAQWINSILPHDPEASYMEPFAGMIGVLLNRDPSKVEVVNDTYDRIVNWWEVVRDKTDELYHKCFYTPFSDTVLEKCTTTIDEGTDVERAWKLFVSFTCSYGGYGPRKKLGVTYAGGAHSSNRARAFERFLEDVHDIANRIRNVQITNRDALEVLSGPISQYDYAIIYCDPPYYSRRKDIYKFNNDFDIDELTEILYTQKGSVAISGVDQEWDHLGWERHEKKINRSVGRGKRREDTEVLWTNYSIPKQGGLYDEKKES